MSALPLAPKARSTAGKLVLGLACAMAGTGASTAKAAAPASQNPPFPENRRAIRIAILPLVTAGAIRWRAGVAPCFQPTRSRLKSYSSLIVTSTKPP
ncbi:MAG: hypothetical protein KJZ64_08740 [Sphingomonadaceae bacterium]|nr:hypothetical protein [Sphingomonadaceae bacterium]